MASDTRSEEALKLYLSFLELSLLGYSLSEPSNVFQDTQDERLVEGLWLEKPTESWLLKTYTPYANHGMRELPQGSKVPLFWDPRCPRKIPAILFLPFLNSGTTESLR